MSTQLGTEDIRSREIAITAKIAGLERDANLVAYDALVGDAAASKRLEIVNAQIEELQNERKLLLRAASAAADREAKETAAEIEARHAAFRADARRHRDALVKIAVEIETTAARMVELRKKAGETNDAIRKAVRLGGYGETISDGVTGRSFNTLDDGIERELVGDHRYGSLSKLVGNAWKALDERHG